MKKIVFLLFLLTVSAATAQKVDMDVLKNLKPRNIGPAGMSGRITAIDVVTNQHLCRIGLRWRVEIHQWWHQMGAHF